MFGDKLKIVYDLKDATGTLKVSVWQESLADILQISAEEILTLYQACDPDEAADTDDAAKNFTDALNVVCNKEKMFILKCTLWNDSPQFALMKIDTSP